MLDKCAIIWLFQSDTVYNVTLVKLYGRGVMKF